MVTISVDYRRPPEHPFPTPLLDVHYTVLWAQLNAEKLGLLLNYNKTVISDYVSSTLLYNMYIAICCDIIIFMWFCNFYRFVAYHELIKFPVLKSLPVAPARIETVTNIKGHKNSY